jgi:hypothetical protein
MPPLRLKPHVRIAVDEGVAVFLDLRRDAYFSAPAAGAAALGLTSGPAGRVHDAPDLARALGARALLEIGADGPRPASAWFGCLMACLWAHHAVRRRRLDRVEYVLRSRFLRARCARGVMGDAAQALSQFMRARPLYPKAQVCLFDSLALAHWLTGQGVRADLVVGVRAHPFAAHCWVEHDGRPINDSTGQSGSYREIWRVSP